MALIQCPECFDTISDKAYMCPHCGYPFHQTVISTKKGRKVRKRRPNGSGTVVRLSGKRKNPFQVRVNTRFNSKKHPIYDVLGYFPDRISAEIALAEYNKSPYDPDDRKKSFSEVFASWYQWKYKVSHTDTDKKTSSQHCVMAAYKKCSSLYDKPMWDIRTPDMQHILEQPGLSHATLEHVRNLLRQMYRYAIQFDMVAKDYSQYTRIKRTMTYKGFHLQKKNWHCCGNIRKYLL